MDGMRIRLLGKDDAEASLAMSADAFGVDRTNRAAFTLGPGLWRWGLFDRDVLVAKANDRAYESFFGANAVATAGVAGVVVAPEYRGRGAARQVMIHLLKAARERGAVLSTLFRTAPALYRSLGYEQIAELLDAELPVSALAGCRVPHGVHLRRAVPGDAPAIRQVYRQVAAEGSGFLSRTGPCFTANDEQLVAGFDGISLAADDEGTVIGYCSWRRGRGIGTGAALSVIDLLALTADGYRALLAALGSFSSVVGTIRLRSTGVDPVHWFVPGPGWTVTAVQPYLLRVLDIHGAIAARGWPPGLAGAVDFSIEDPVCPWNSGEHRLVIDGGRGRIEPGTSSGAHFTPGGLAVLYAGGVPAVTLRRAGLLRGGGRAADALLDAAFAGPKPGVHDFF